MYRYVSKLVHLLLPATISSVGFLAVSAVPCSAQSQLWVEQLGTAAGDEGHAVAPDGSGGVFVGGFTGGSLGGLSAGDDDVWLARYDDKGVQKWMAQLGTSEQDQAWAAAPDAAGGFYVGGFTRGALSGTNAGDMDAWLARYDGAGAQLWVRQLGTNGEDWLRAAVPDGSGGVFVGGSADGALGGPHSGDWDAWLARYDSAGNQVWIRQLGTSTQDGVWAGASDGSGGVFVSGRTGGSLGGGHAGGGDDVWLARYDSSGNQIWIDQIGSSKADRGRAAAPDGFGGVYVGGWTNGDLGGPNIGYNDVWLARYDSGGAQQWILQLGTSGWDRGWALAPDSSGGVYMGGHTGGSLGAPNAGTNDAWLSHFDSGGSQLWIRQLGTSGWDQSWATAPDNSGGVYVSGLTEGSLGGPSAGNRDAWLARYDDTCPPLSTYCTSKPASIAGCTPIVTYSGTPSASAGSGFDVQVGPMPGAGIGIFIYTTNGAAASPIQNVFGWLCIQTGPGLFRISPQLTGGTNGVCDGQMVIDFNQYFVTQTNNSKLVSGAQVDIQAWYRDPPSPGGANLTQAGQFVMCP